MSQITKGYKRILNLPDLVFLGLSMTIGAGIFVLLNNVAGHAKQLSWVAILLAGIICLLTAMSYAELSSIFRNNEAEYGYIKSVTNDTVANISGVLILVADVFIMATVTLGLSYYIGTIVKINPVIIAIPIVLFINYLNYRGIRTSKNVSRVLLYMKIFILLAIIFLGFMFFRGVSGESLVNTEGVNQHEMFIAAIIGLFAFLGFNNLINLSEETINPGINIPKSLLYTLLISIVLYTLFTVSSLMILGSKGLSGTEVPLAAITNKLFGSYGKYFFVVLAIVALFDTLLVTNVSESRYVNAVFSNMSKKFGAKDMSKYGTPYISIGILVVLTIIFILVAKNMEKLAIWGDSLILVIFIVVNVIVIVLRYRVPDEERKFKMPLNVGRFPVTAGLAILISVYGLYVYVMNR